MEAYAVKDNRFPLVQFGGFTVSLNHAVDGSAGLGQPFQGTIHGGKWLTRLSVAE